MRKEEGIADRAGVGKAKEGKEGRKGTGKRWEGKGGKGEGCGLQLQLLDPPVSFVSMLAS